MQNMIAGSFPISDVGYLDKEDFMQLVVKSLESIKSHYREPYQSIYERIICYEFYHQFRTIMEAMNSPYILHGELDKQYRHEKQKPDFVFHIPGTEKNLAILEFKNAKYLNRIKTDLEKLHKFMNAPYGYKIGILVIFGQSYEIQKIQQHLDSMSLDDTVTVLFYETGEGKVVATKVI